jgi:hypothetical protein
MVFGITTGGNLRDEIFCLTEERNFFRTKLLESVSEMTALQKELQAQKRQVDRLRRELLESSKRNLINPNASVGGGVDGEKIVAKPDETEDSTMSSTAVSESRLPIHNADDDDDEHIDTDADSAKGIRQSAEKLLQWASYRSSLRSTLSTDSRDDRHPIQSITFLLDDGEKEEEDDEEEGSDGASLEEEEEEEVGESSLNGKEYLER